MLPPSPPSVGDLAPALRGSKPPGAPSILVFHDPAWDPARADEVESYRRLIAATDARTPAQPILIPNDDPAADAYGVARTAAVFVIDASGHVAWRHVAGIDSVERAAEVAVDLSHVDAARAYPFGGRWSRREFVATAIGAAVALTLEPTLNRAEAAVDRAAGGNSNAAPVGEARPVTLNVNGRNITLKLEPRVTLLDALREYAGLTGSKKGCDHGQCGACTVHVDGRRVLSCLTFAVMQQGKPITTIEGLAASAGANGDALHPMQQAFIEHDGFQCGYCTSGQIMSATAVVREPWGPADDDVREAMSGNICRCGAYAGIVAAVQDVRQKGGAR
jgi:xanthine dehydrogenase YagT iron-sulfur-binding subunit